MIIKTNKVTIKRPDTNTAVVINDLHIPYQDNIAIALVLSFLKECKPDEIIINGDFLDFYSLSSFDKDPNRVNGLQEEIDVGNEILDKIQAASPKSQITFIPGNHELRLQKYLWKTAKELNSLSFLTIEGMLRLEERDIIYIDPIGKEASTGFGPIEVGHFDLVRKESCYTAKALLDERAESLIQGHTHRLGAFYRTYRGQNRKAVAAYESGCLCCLDPEYVKHPNWQQGFAVINRVKNTKRFHVKLIPIIQKEMFIDGKMFSFK